MLEVTMDMLIKFVILTVQVLIIFISLSVSHKLLMPELELYGYEIKKYPKRVLLATLSHTEAILILLLGLFQGNLSIALCASPIFIVTMLILKFYKQR